MITTDLEVEAQPIGSLGVGDKFLRPALLSHQRVAESQTGLLVVMSADECRGASGCATEPVVIESGQPLGASQADVSGLREGADLSSLRQGPRTARSHATVMQYDRSSIQFSGSNREAVRQSEGPPCLDSWYAEPWPEPPGPPL